jgi:cysteinyl-tRNA synthetase
MSTKYLGAQFDIHGGGMDLKFPHHECEIAQNKASHGHEGVNYWMHGNMLTLNGQRMSKSTGNTLLPGELFSGNTSKLTKGFKPSVARFFMMQAHYGSQLDFSNEALLAAEKGYQKLMDAWQKLEKAQALEGNDFNVADWREKCYAAMNDDFNSPILIAHLFEAVRFINTGAEEGLALSAESLEILKSTFKAFVFEVLGLEESLDEENHQKLDEVMQVLIDLRATARADRNFPLSDAIRDKLSAAGITLKDGKDGSTYSFT